MNEHSLVILEERESASFSTFLHFTLTKMEKRDAEKQQQLIMASERTPLIQSVPVAEQRDRYPHSTVSTLLASPMV